MVVVLSVSTNIFHMSIFFFHFLIVSQQVCGLLTGKEKKTRYQNVSRSFAFSRNTGLFLFFVLYFFFLFSKKSSHDKKKHQWGHFIVLI